MIDYVLTAAVGIFAGVGAMVSTLPVMLVPKFDQLEMETATAGASPRNPNEHPGCQSDRNKVGLKFHTGAWKRVLADRLSKGKMTIEHKVAGATLEAAHGVKEDAKTQARDFGIDKESTKHCDMTVTELKMAVPSESRNIRLVCAF